MYHFVCIVLPALLAFLTFAKARNCRHTRRIHLAKFLMLISIVSGALAVIFIVTAIAS